jgi:hypothetical protein
MTTITGSEFAAHPEMYLDMARHDDVRVHKGHETFWLIHEPPGEPPILEPDDDFRRAISVDELRRSAHEHIRSLFAKQ